MKKNLFVACSLILAVALFAFTTVYSGKQKSPDPKYYWYSVTYDGSTPMIEYQSPSAPLTVVEASGSLECEGDDRVCRAGFTTPLPFDGTDPILENTDGEVHFKETDPNK